MCYFSVYKLIEWDAANTCLNYSELCPKLTIKRVESRSGILLLTLNNFHFFSFSIVDFKLVNSFRGALSSVNIITQSLFSTSKDEQILYLTIDIEGRDVNIIQNSADFLNV